MSISAASVRSRCMFQRRVNGLPFLVTSTAGVSIFLSIAHAQVSLTEADYLEELPVVVSASRLAQSANETPTAVTVIDRDMIRASGATELPDVLRLVPGMVVGFPVGYTASTSYHGLSSNYARRMQVLIDGRTVYESSFGGVNWMGIPLALDDIERIEVVRGPAAASHGANALLGVISITTRAAAAQEGLDVRAVKGSNDIEGGLLRLGRSGEQFDYRITAEHRANAGLVDVLDDYFVNQVSFRGDLHRSQVNLISFAAGYSDTHADTGDSRTPPHGAVSKANFEQVSWRHLFSPQQELNIQLYHNLARDEEAWSTDRIAYVRDAKKERFDAELQHTVVFDDRHRVVWGGGARRDEVTDAATFNTTETQSIDLYRLFANFESRFGERWVAHAGAMWESHDLVGEDISPRAALNYHITPRHTLRAGYARAYRNPVLSEERGDLRFRDPAGNTILTIFRGTGGLEPEQVDSYEVGYVGTYLQQGITLDVKVYQDKIENLIRSITDPTTRVATFRNLDSAEITGVEVEVMLQRVARQRVYLSYAYEEIDSADIAANYTASAPRNKFSLLALQGFGPHLEASALYTYVDKMEWLGTRDPLDSYDRLDLRLAYLWTRGRLDGEVAAVLQGLSGDYGDFLSTHPFDRRGYLTLNLHFL